MTARRLTELTGADRLTFLQGLVSNDVLKLAKGPGIVWAALLTPQGKYLADFFIVQTDTALLLDMPEAQADATLRRLAMYRLRADVQLAPCALQVTRGLRDAPPGAMPDPRHPALGWRHYSADKPAVEDINWDAIRVEHLIPESGIELQSDESYILEHGFERLKGVDFRKGCYVGQEVTARMKHKTELRKGLARLRITGSAPVGTEILSDGKSAGQVFTQSGGRALAYVRFDRLSQNMTAGDARLTPDETP